MLIRELSDLHLEHSPYYVPKMKGDDESVLILAGDICIANRITKSMHDFFAMVNSRFRKVIYVTGNHEYYHGNLSHTKTVLTNYLKASGFDNICLLDCSSTVIDRTVFIGATMWTDMDKGNIQARALIHNSLNDFVYIKKGSKVLTAKDTEILHTKHKKFIFDSIAEYRKKAQDIDKIVVISHHAPSELSIHPRFKGSPINHGFVSNLNDEIQAGGPDIWFHGHCHNSMNYTIGHTEVICNPRGYAKLMDLNAYNNAPSIPPIDVDDPNSGKYMASFDGIFRQENTEFNPFLRID